MINLTHLHHQLQRLGRNYQLPENWLQQRPELFASALAPVSQSDITAMQTLITAIETVVALPQYQQYVLSQALPIAQQDPKTLGVFFGYDFHLTPTGPKLIEINTNAGGAGLLALLEMALCAEKQLAISDPLSWQEDFFLMFLQEWQRLRGSQPLARIAIVDIDPTQQYYYPEFVLFQSLFKSKGVDGIIADPSTLTLKQGQLQQNGLDIDLVYNRLTDFSLSSPSNAALRQAYLEGAATVTPHPHAHALYADKRNLAILSDFNLLNSWGVETVTIESLRQGIPHTFVVNPQHADTLWTLRKGLFFKPVAGYAGKGTYRGASITRKVFNEILSSDYIAQELVPPSTQTITLEQETAPFKVDIRNYVYQGNVLKIAARLYQGQVTNFRTQGGGFAAICQQD